MYSYSYRTAYGGWGMGDGLSEGSINQMGMGDGNGDDDGAWKQSINQSGQ